MVLFITWVAFLLRTVNLGTQSLWRDEVDAIRFSSWSLADLLAGLFRTGHNGPLFFLFLRLWRNLTGNSEFALRYPSVFFGTLAIPLGIVLALQLGLSRRIGLLLSLLLATSLTSPSHFAALRGGFSMRSCDCSVRSSWLDSL